MKKFKLTCAMILLSAVCSVAQIKVLPISEKDMNIKSLPEIYFLPQTSFQIKLTIETETLIPGPYAKYAEKYLSIKNASTSEISDMRIENIEIKEFTQADPNACFVVIGDSESKISCNNSGIITSYNLGKVSDNQTVFFEHNFNSEGTSVKLPEYTDFGVERNFIGNTDTTYKVVEVDSVFQKIPIYNKVIVSKNEEQKAEEAANYILEIRKNYFNIITTKFDVDIPPSDISIMVEELKRLEAQYLTLFVGKVVKEKNEYVFYYTPENDLTEAIVPICYITSDNDVVSEKTENSVPVNLILKKSETTNKLSKFYNSQLVLQDNEKEKGLFYRVPADVAVSVECEDFTYYRNLFTIPQCGYLGHLSSKMFKNKELKIEFNEKYGSIKSLSTK